MNELVNLFTQEHGSYQDKFKFNSVLFFIIIVIIFTKFAGVNYIGVVVVFSFALVLTNLYVKVSNNQLLDKNKTINFKLNSLQDKINEYILYKINQASTTRGNSLSNEDKQKLYKRNNLDSLYIDANLIIFLYSIIKLYDYNQVEFYLLLKGTNNILKLKNDIEKFYKANKEYPENIHEMLQIAIQLKANCINNLHNIIYKVPKNKQMYNYIDNSIIGYNRLITYNIKQMHKYHQDYIRVNGVNTRTKFIDINGPKMYNPEYNHPVIPSKFNHQKLIDLYV